MAHDSCDCNIFPYGKIILRNNAYEIAIYIARVLLFHDEFKEIVENHTDDGKQEQRLEQRQ